jgi:predicted Fe-Mo cluster-binding NifX family protein
MIRIALPVFHKRVSPVLDNCTRLLVIDFAQGSEISKQDITLEKFSLVERFNLIKKMNINVIICCAISEVMDHMIKGTDIQLICGIAGDVNQVIAAYLSNHLDDAAFHMPGYSETP